MELLTKLGIDGRLLFWQVINFAVLLVILRKFAYGPILAALRKRREEIERGLENAKRTEEKLRATEADRERELSEARKHASRIIADTEAAAERMREHAAQKTKEEIQAMLSAGREQIERERDEMIREAKRELGTLITMGVDKVVGQAARQIDAGPIVAEAVRELTKNL